MRFLYLILVITTILFSNCYATINQVQTMKEVMHSFKKADKDTLAVFDIDMVLIQPSDPAFQMANIKRYSTIAKRIIFSLPENKRDIFFTLMAMNSDSVLVDEKTPAFLEKLVQNEIPTIALTANLTGQFVNIPNLEVWKKECLQQVGIDFSKGAPFEERIVFDRLSSFRKNYPHYVDGILFSNGSRCSKGEVLVHFLQTAKMSPKKIIFVDDREENLKSVEEAILLYNPTIQYEGYHYIGATDYPSPILSEKEFVARWESKMGQAKEIE